MIKKGNLYYPDKESKNNAWANKESIYKEALKDPLRFWEKAAQDIVWQKKWQKVFNHQPPYYQWFLGGKLNITESALDRHLKGKKNKVAIIWEPEPIGERGRIITYYELFRRVNKLANALKKIGVKKGDRVGIYLPLVPEAIISMLACARLGAVHVVVFSAFSSQALKVRLETTGAKILITADGYYRRGKMVNLKESADSAVEGTMVKKIIVVKRLGIQTNWRQGRDFCYDDLVKKESGWFKPTAMDAQDLLFILPTSGSTGKPKGTMQAIGGYAVSAALTGKWIFDLKDDDIFWSTSDLGWITGHTYSCYSPLLNGATYVLFEGAPDWPAPDRWTRIVSKYGVTVFYTAPTAIRMFQKYGQELIDKNKLKTLRLLGSVGEPIAESTWQWFFEHIGQKKCPLVDTWWQTETGGILITSLPGIGPFKPGFSGRPFPGIRAEIFDENGKPCPYKKEGNLVILPPFAPGFLRGVYKNDKKYRKTYWSQYGNKVYFTSDAAYKDKNGLIRIVGRVDDVIKVAGHRLTTGELEAAIICYPKAIEAAVVGVPDEIKGEAAVAFVVLKGDLNKETAQKEIIETVRREIGPIATLKKIYFVVDLPKTRSGKIMRRILKKLLTDEELGDISTLAAPEVVAEIRKNIQMSGLIKN